MYVIFKFQGENSTVRSLYQDDVIGRQTIVKRDAKSLGIEENALYLLIEGSEDSIERARKIAGEYELKGEEREKIYKKIKESEEEASLGMGAIFG